MWHMRKSVVTVGRKTVRCIVEACQKQADPQHIKADQYMKYNRVMRKAGRTQKVR